MIPYLGSKFNLSDFIIPEIPNNISTYIEPFGGGAGLYFKMDLDRYPNCRFIYNDINSLNSNLISSLKNPSFIDQVKNTNVSLDLFLNSFDNLVHKNQESISWLIILCCSNMKDLMSKEYNGCSKFEIFKLRVDSYRQHLERIEVKNLDYKNVVKIYDSKESFFYFDPPYVGYESYYTGNDFTVNSHLELSDIVKSIIGKCAISYYKFKEMEELYKGFNIKHKSHNLSTEYLIYN